MLLAGFPPIWRRCFLIAPMAVVCLALVYGQRLSPGSTTGTHPSAADPHAAMLNQYCVACHNDKAHTAGISVQHLNPANVGENADVWEKVLRQVSSGQMPPNGMPHPDTAARAVFANWLETSLDHSAAEHPNPGRPAIHRLNRAEYSNAIRDLLALNFDSTSMLPADDSGYGFDNVADVLSISPVLLERYMAVARKVSRLAIGDPKILPAVDQVPVPRGMANMEQVSDDLPLGSNGGAAIHHYFPVDGVYTIRVLLRPKPGASDDKPHFDVRIPVKAGARIIGVTFLDDSSLKESVAPPPKGRRFVPPPAAGKMGDIPPSQLDLRLDDARVKMFEVGWLNPVIDSVWVGGPYDIQGSGETASRERIFSCRPAGPSEEEPCAKKILSTLARHAYRRPVTDADIQPLLGFYRSGRKDGTFDSGIELALRAILVSPDFLFRVERDPAGSAPGAAHRISDVELASRLSFFLWSSIPDDELISLAEQKKLHDPVVLQRQVRRMLADSKSNALVTNFAGQWLYLRNLDRVTPDPDAFPEFDDGLRACFKRETELFLDSIMRQDRSVVDLLGANYTFVNERLAKFYGIPDVHGTTFRRVALADADRGGLLGQASILTVTSYPNRTSVVQRGKWILENVLGTPPPPQPANVPDLKSHGEDGRLLTMRQQMELHRANPVCASCHSRMDPLGFALENFDGVGKWRTKEAGLAIDASAKLPDGTAFNGPSELKKVLLAHRDEFVKTMSDKLLTYAIGRGTEYYDEPAIREIARDAARDDYRFSSLVTAIVKSTPFEMRRTPEP